MTIVNSVQNPIYIDNRLEQRPVDNDGREIDVLKSEIDELKNILITFGVIIGLFSLVACWWKSSAWLQKVKNVFDCIHKIRPQHHEIPMTIIEERASVRTVVTTDNEEQPEANQTELEALLIPAPVSHQALPSAPKIG